ncbi:MAG: YfiR family protein [Pseudomonadota bacterium]|nr:YfiR family protein [Pseudomonadota bacterium]
MRATVLLLFALAGAGSGRAAEPSEYQLKAAVLYNFALFTDWPADVGSTLKLCVHGSDPFGPELDELQGKAVHQRHISVERKAAPYTLRSCQIVFISRSSADLLPDTLQRLQGTPALTVAESAGATRQGVMLNMDVSASKITFSANVKAAQQARLTLSSKLLKLATEVVR